MKEGNLSCVDCGVCVCSSEDGTYPGFCLTANMDEAVKAEIMERYDDEVNRKVMQTAAAVEYEGYCRWPRVQETVEFAKRMGFHKIGIATCVGLIRESRALARVLRSHGFEVYGIGCKIGAVPKTDVGIDRACSAVGSNMCNPIMQAELLNREGTEPEYRRRPVRGPRQPVLQVFSGCDHDFDRQGSGDRPQPGGSPVQSGFLLRQTVRR